MRHLKRQRYILLTTACIFGVFSFLGSADATKWFFGSDTELSIDVTLTYGAGVKVSEMNDPPPYAPIDPTSTDPAYAAYVTSINRDDGKRNFDQWDFYNNKISALADIELIWKNFGVFVRPKAFYDHTYMTDNSNDSPSTNNAYLTGLIDSSDQWTDAVEDVHGKNAEILDLFAYTNFRLGNVPFDVRVGNQVISWGESTFVPGISLAQSPIDASAATAAGTEVKEIYLPTGAVYVQTGFGDLGFRAYYQWEWERMRLMEGGTFFSQFDATDEQRASFLASENLAAVTRGEDIDAKDDGQYGIALTYILPWNFTEIGVYYLNYHEKNFTLELVGAEYFLRFEEDIKLYGLSASTTLGDTQVYLEASYRDDFRCMTADLPPLHENGDYMQVQAGFTHVFSPAPFGIADRSTLAGEAAFGQQFELGDTDLAADEEPGMENEAGFTYVMVLMNEWFQVFKRTDLGLDFIFQDTPIGTIPQFNFFEHYSAFSVTGKVTFNDVWKLGLTYENRFQQHFLQDMDTLSLKLSYTF